MPLLGEKKIEGKDKEMMPLDQRKFNTEKVYAVMFSEKTNQLTHRYLKAFVQDPQYSYSDQMMMMTMTSTFLHLDQCIQHQRLISLLECCYYPSFPFHQQILCTAAVVAAVIVHTLVSPSCTIYGHSSI
jgi:hypothetical protein